MEKIRTVVVGLNHGAEYIPIILKHPHMELVGLVDMDSSCLQRLVSQHNVSGFGNVKEMVKSEIADAVIIAVPTRFHADISIICLEAGLHVLQEKPLCCTGEEASAIGKAVSRSGKIFQVGYEVRSSPLHISIMRHIRDGDLGIVTNVWYNQHTLESRTAGWCSERSGMGGKLFDCAVHYLDLLQQWAGAPVCRIAALGNRLEMTGPCEKDIPDSAAISIEYQNGVRGTFNFGSKNDFHNDSSFGVAGTTGQIMGDPWYPEGAGSYDLRMDKGLYKCRIVFDGKLTSPGHLGFKEQLDNFVNTVLHGSANICSFEDALAVHRQMKSIDQSLSSGQVITI